MEEAARKELGQAFCSYWGKGFFACATKDAQGADLLQQVLNEIQDVITKQVTNQFEVAEEEARFARNEVHDEALTDFKKMYSQRYAN